MADDSLGDLTDNTHKAVHVDSFVGVEIPLSIVQPEFVGFIHSLRSHHYFQ